MADALTPDLRERLRGVCARIERAARRAGRDPAEIALVGIAKRKPARLVAEAVRAGLEHVGESYVQEAARKLPELMELLAASGTAPPRRHLVGRLQRNKARDAVRLFDVVESVDRPALAEALDRRARAEARALEVLVQVDLAGEPQKGGTSPAGLPGLLDRIGALPGLRLRGLMAVPPASPDPERSRPFFAQLRALGEAHAACFAASPAVLSMGMSADFEVAVEEGATWVRVGTAIFGTREGRA